ncbi:MAG TPA: hypothetical protein VHJ34_03260 [Actinomycetota bacterium]|nr:hypothetical protein [Actinomycetota bacterium]
MRVNGVVRVPSRAAPLGTIGGSTAGCLAGVVLGIVASRPIEYAAALRWGSADEVPLVFAGAVVGALAGTTRLWRAHAAIPLAATYGMFAGTVVARALEARTGAQTTVLIVCVFGMAAVGLVAGALSPSWRSGIAWASMLSCTVVAVVATRLWIEDYPSWPAVAALVVGSAAGLAAAAPLARAVPVLIGAIAGAAVALYVVIPYIWMRVDGRPEILTAALVIVTFVGVLVGLLASVRSARGETHAVG